MTNRLATPHDLSNFSRLHIGLDRMLSDLLRLQSGQASSNYPPYNLIKLGPLAYQVELAVAGFSADDLDVTLDNQQLIVSGVDSSEQDTTAEVIHRGIGGRSFRRVFSLADHMVVTGSTLRDGVLSISLAIEVPEELKPKKIQISYIT